MIVVEDLLRLCVLGVSVVKPDIIKDVAVCNDYVPEPVVIIIDHPNAETATVESHIAQLCGISRVVKGTIFEIVVKPRVFEVQVSHKYVQPTIVCGVPGVSTHACFGTAVLAGGNPSHIGPFAEGSVTVVVKQKVGHRIVGDKDVLPAVF